MDFSKATSLLKQRKIDRRRAIQGDAPADKLEFLYVQSFHGGAITARDDAAGTYTVTFEHGLGQTIYFSDRPNRVVGTAPTAQFLERFDFSASNPPNAAIVFEAEEGVDIAVVEMTNPVYDEASGTATYDLKVLQNSTNVDGDFHGTTADLESLATQFGAAHLLIDDMCYQPQDVLCKHADEWGFPSDTDGQRDLGSLDVCWYRFDPRALPECLPCNFDTLGQRCAVSFPDFCNDATPCAAEWPGYWD